MRNAVLCFYLIISFNNPWDIFMRIYSAESQQIRRGRVFLGKRGEKTLVHAQINHAQFIFRNIKKILKAVFCRIRIANNAANSVFKKSKSTPNQPPAPPQNSKISPALNATMRRYDNFGSGKPKI